MSENNFTNNSNKALEISSFGAVRGNGAETENSRAGIFSKEEILEKIAAGNADYIAFFLKSFSYNLILK